MTKIVSLPVMADDPALLLEFPEKRCSGQGCKDIELDGIDVVLLQESQRVFKNADIVSVQDNNHAGECGPGAGGS